MTFEASSTATHPGGPGRASVLMLRLLIIKLVVFGWLAGQTVLQADEIRPPDIQTGAPRAISTPSLIREVGRRSELSSSRTDVRHVKRDTLKLFQGNQVRETQESGPAEATLADAAWNLNSDVTGVEPRLIQSTSASDSMQHSSPPTDAIPVTEDFDDWRSALATTLGGRQARAAATETAAANHSKQLTIAGQRLLIPCKISSRIPLSVDQTRRTGPPPRTRLPSQNGPTPAANSIALIVWHKDDQLNSPIFTVDARGGSIKDAKQQAIADSLKGRARVDFGDSPAPVGATLALVISEARLDDAGLYTCTVEFDRAPTQTYQTSVGVLDPPKNLVIREDMNGLQRQVRTRLAGPYDEDSSLALVCEAEPGQPEMGQVSWWQLDSVTQIAVSDLRASAVSRGTSGGVPSTRNGASQAASLSAASYLTTLSLDQADSDVALPISNSASRQNGALFQPSPTGRDLFLGARSFHAQQNQQMTTSQQLVGQLFASSNPTGNGLLQLISGGLTSANPTIKLRHWRRVSAQKSGSVTVTSRADSSQQLISARLEIQTLTRTNLGNEFLCLAMNNLFAAPLNASVSLDMNLRPTEVRLANKQNVTFRLGQRTIVECHVIGSRPSATIRWFRGPHEIELDRSRTSGMEHSSNSSLATSEINRDINTLTKISYLTLSPQISDNQQPLTCSASNPKLNSNSNSNSNTDTDSTLPSSESQLSDSLVMDVQYPPRPILKLGAGIQPDSIRLHSDVFMDCEIEANPPIQELGWLHEGRPLAANNSAEIFMSNQSLVLRNINVSQRGVYECQARNMLGGPVTSNRLALRPRFEPICDVALTRRRYEIPLNQPTRIECHVLAEPDEDLEFSWRFNSSRLPASSGVDGDSSETAGFNSLPVMDQTINSYETNFTKGTVIFTARSRLHFGQLLCSATNSMGKQEKPCVIELVQSELPEPVRGCFIDKPTHNSFSILCQAPGPPQPQQPASSNSGASSSSSGASSSHSFKLASTHYILELYTSGGGIGAESQSSRTNERDSPPSESMLQQLTGSRNDGSSDYEADEREPASGRSQPQVRLRRLVSELPSFDVLDLKPNSTYNILIYVQNAKGRSAPAHHQVSTKPLLGATSESNGRAGDLQEAAASTSGGGRLELVEKRAKQPLSTTSQLLAFLKIDERWWSGGSEYSRRPLIGVVLVVLLSVVSVMMLVFFVNRVICRRSASSARQRQVADNPTKRKCSTGGSSSSPTNERELDDDEEDGSSYMRRKQNGAQSGPNKTTNRTSTNLTVRALAPADQKKRTKGCPVQQIGPGSGSDTSRETNTESTLISSKTTPGRTTTDSNQSSSREQQLSSEMCCASLAGTHTHNPIGLTQVDRHKRCSHSDLSQLVAAGLIDTCQDDARFKSTTLKPQTRLMMAMRACDDQQAVVNIMHQQHPNGSIYGTLQHGRLHSNPQQHELLADDQAHQLQHSNGFGGGGGGSGGHSHGTPQVSIHSSECSSNNVDNSVDSMSHEHHLRRHHHQQHRNSNMGNQLHWLASHNNYQLMAGKAASEQHDHLNLAGTDGGVYVIGGPHDGALHPGGSPIGLIDAADTTNFWCHPSEAIPSSLVAGDSSRCHLVQGTDNAPQMDGFQRGLVPTSLSIPVSLNSRFELMPSGGRSSSVGIWNEQLQQQQQQSRRLSSAENLLLLRRDQELLHRASLTGEDQQAFATYQLQDPHAAPNLWQGTAACPVIAHALSCEASSVCFASPDASTGAGQHLTPPINFANDYRQQQQQHFQHDPRVATPSRDGSQRGDSNGDGELTRKRPAAGQQQPAPRHRVKFDTSSAGTAEFGLNLPRENSA